MAGTSIRPEVDILETGIVVATEAHRRHTLAMVPDWHNRTVIMQLAFGALAVYNLRPLDHTPVEEVDILWALEGGTHIRAHNGALGLFERVFLSSASRRIKANMMALEGLFRKLGAHMGARP